MKFGFVMTFVAGLLVSGCGSAVRTNVAIFHGVGHAERGTIAAVAKSPSQENSLQFKKISEYVKQKFEEIGYKPISDKEYADYLFSIDYEIDGGRTVTNSVPLFGQTGGGTSFTTGTVSSGYGYGTYNAVTTTTPTYGIVGTTLVSATLYKRMVNIDVMRRSGDEMRKVYEIRAESTGTCDNINAIIYQIIDGAFKEFPGESGRTYTVEVPWDSSC